MFRAYDPERDRLVAVKLFTVALAPERVHELVADFERLIAAALAHDAIAAPLATGLSGVSAYLAYDYVAAESLDLAIRAYGPAPAGDALRVATQLAGALDYAAAVNIHHGALHPRDVLLSPEETRLTGLGVARALERAGVTPPVRRPYSPPERIAGAAWDRRADLFSLAAVIHELVWGRRIAGTGVQVADALTDVAQGDLPALKSLFARALADDPTARFETALEFAEALKNAFPHVAVVVPSPAPRVARKACAETEPRLPLGDPESPSADVAPGPVLEPPADAERSATPDWDLRAAEDARYADVEVAPAIVMDNLSTTEDTEDTEAKSFSGKDWSSASTVSSVVERSSASVPAGLILGGAPEPPPSRSWPLGVMLIFGAVAGLALGYLMWSRSNSVTTPPAIVANEAPTPAPPAGREFTESTVPPPSKPAGAGRGANEPGAPGPEARRASAEPRTPEPRVRVNPGRLLVRSTPAGATVFVDGREHGRTPVAVRDLARGAHRVRIVRDGYAPAERRVVITQSQPAQSLLVPLAAPRATASRGTESTAPGRSTPATTGQFTGDLVVESKPSGARVYVDNKLAGTTPLSLPHVPAGNHVVRLERDGYRRWSSSVRIVAAERNRVTASLER